MSSRGGEQQIPRPPMVRLGSPAPWLRLPPEARRLSLADVRSVCAKLPAPRRPRAAVPGLRAAAVLVPLFEEEGEARVVLTKRPDTMPSHRGDVAFPGGKVQPGVDRSVVDAALREAHEEIGLPSEAVEVVAELDTLSTVTTRFLVAPFVGLLRHRPVLRPDPREVERVFDVALSELLADDVHREEHWGLGPLSRPVHFFELAPGVRGVTEEPSVRGVTEEPSVRGVPEVGETIWGATARILAEFLAVLTAGR